jgi:hypothetical protein
MVMAISAVPWKYEIPKMLLKDIPKKAVLNLRKRETETILYTLKENSNPSSFKVQT